ncbi:hypothetical protein SAMN05444141_105387 [Pseudovibrio denitrificans]|uniref:Uncharacterized protein n=2 Tax=Pseudovibrio TaxID=258255 RepID=A0A1I7CAW9_9HYPH|nr:MULTISPECIES: hypothetical protein [Pseudovibrio]QUS57048.1 hypothetical protein KGB56_06480 [Pseudovibrio brasiliensis]SFT96548.1 hypothetical protein SAMN05444141_105387 [Pseudovibrio denitrificans]
MDALQRAARASVARICGFYCLGVLFIMAALSFDPASSFRAGAMLAIALSAALVYKAWNMPFNKNDGDDAWALIKSQDSSSQDPNRLHSDALRTAYHEYSKRAMVVALGLWFVSVVASFSD